MMQGRERGAVAVTMAISLLLLVGMTALALDGGLAYNERRTTQNAADHAALAAAWAECNSHPDPAAVGRDSAAANHPESTVNVFKDGTSGNWIAEVEIDQDTTFARSIGTARVTVISEAQANCTSTGALGGYAIFAGGLPNCMGGEELSITGGTNNINGKIHSNGQGKIQGGSANLSHTVTYHPSTTFNPQPTHNYNGTPPHQADGPHPYPVEWNITDFAPGQPRAVAAGSQYYAYTGSPTKTELERSGLHYVAGDVHIPAAGGLSPSGPITLVSTGTIHIAGPFTNVNHYESDGLLFFSNATTPPSCAAHVITWSMSQGSWTGVWYAPNGSIQLHSAGANTSTGQGSLIGLAINTAGGTRTINYDDSLGGARKFTVELQK